MNKAIRHDCWICRSLHLSYRSGLLDRSNHAGMGVGAMDQAEAANLEDQFDLVVRRILASNGVGTLCALDHPFRRRWRIRKDRAELRTRLRFLLQVRSTGHASLSFKYCFCDRRRMAIELASLARSDRCYRRLGILATRDNMAVTNDSGRVVRNSKTAQEFSFASKPGSN